MLGKSKVFIIESKIAFIPRPVVLLQAAAFWLRLGAAEFCFVKEATLFSPSYMCRNRILLTSFTSTGPAESSPAFRGGSSKFFYIYCHIFEK